MKNSKTCAGAALLAAAAAAGYLVWENGALELSEFTCESPKIPAGFDGFKIALISDLHARSFGKNNSRLLALLKKAKPDIIALTGDIFDRHTERGERAALAFIEGAAKISPCFFVSGNHEAKLSRAVYKGYMDALKGEGVRILDNERAILKRGGDEISLLGLADFKMDPRSYGRDIQVSTDMRLSRLSRPGEGFQILLTHRPEQLEVYSRCGMDLVLAGHTHGGQWRLPLIGAVFIPNQGFFPAISDGKYRLEDTAMIVSRGLGASNIRFRAFNRPQVALVSLKRGTE
ncbi:MAG: metallophosphoesterase [Oscillospiraceae bacterium]|nr:metallophosphoesterase [Oscillospiraceae bacterium]